MARKPARPVSARPQREVATTTIQRASLHVGPLPAPEVLAHYDNLIPGSAERIIAMAERQQAHRMDMDRASLQSDIDSRTRQENTEVDRLKGIFLSDKIGQILGALVAILALAGAAYTAYIKCPWQIPGLFLSLPVLGMIKAIRAGVSKTKADRDTSK